MTSDRPRDIGETLRRLRDRLTKAIRGALDRLSGRREGN